MCFSCKISAVCMLLACLLMSGEFSWWFFIAIITFSIQCFWVNCFFIYIYIFELIGWELLENWTSLLETKVNILGLLWKKDKDVRSVSVGESSLKNWWVRKGIFKVCEWILYRLCCVAVMNFHCHLLWRIWILTRLITWNGSWIWKILDSTNKRVA